MLLVWQFLLPILAPSLFGCHQLVAVEAWAASWLDKLRVMHRLLWKPKQKHHGAFLHVNTGMITIILQMSHFSIFSAARRLLNGFEGKENDEDGRSLVDMKQIRLFDWWNRQGTGPNEGKMRWMYIWSQASTGLTLPTLSVVKSWVEQQGFFFPPHVNYIIKRKCEEDGCSFLGHQWKENTWDAEYILFLLQSVGLQPFLTFSVQSYI